MPGHIYIRVGRYRDVIQANQHATKADAGYLSHSHSEGIYPLAYVPHNHHFLWAATIKLGMKNVSLETAEDTADHVDQTMLTSPGLGATLQHFAIIPLYTKALFGEWESILQEPAPTLLYPKGVWHYARGLAYLRKGNIEQAQLELVALRTVANDPQIADLKVFGLNRVSHLLQIGTEILAGEFAASQLRTKEAVAHLRHAIALEDGLTYTEPKDWYLPPRQVLGAVLLEAGRPEEAERVYRQDLKYHPQNGWSLFGLRESLQAQGKLHEAEKVNSEFQTAWADADVTLTSSRF
jgi:tetratricopeptide (TPR) repeat protein